MQNQGNAKLKTRLLLIIAFFSASAYCMSQETVLPSVALSVSETDAQALSNNVIDGDPHTYWEMPLRKDEAFVTVDMGTDVLVSKAVITIAPAISSQKVYISVFGMDASGSDFMMVSPRTTRSLTSGVNVITIALSGTTRFIQVRFSGESGDGAIRVHEIQVYGTTGVETNSNQNTR